MRAGGAAESRDVRAEESSGESQLAARAVERTGLRLFLEGMVVLLSILAAFFLEGWSDDRQLAQEVRQELASVSLELQRNREVVEAEIDAIRRVTTGASLLIEAMEAADGTDEVLHLLYR